MCFFPTLDGQFNNLLSPVHMANTPTKTTMEPKHHPKMKNEKEKHRTQTFISIHFWIPCYFFGFKKYPSCFFVVFLRYMDVKNSQGSS